MPTNHRLYDIATRHQVYVEGVKASQRFEFNVVTKQLYAELTAIFSKIKFKTLDEMTKGELRSLLGKVNSAQEKIYSEYSAKLIKQLQDFMLADILVSKVTLTTTDEDRNAFIPLSEKDADAALEKQVSGIYPILWYISTSRGGTPDKLWSEIINAPIPANGILPIKMIEKFTASASAALIDTIRKGYANKSPVADVLTEITGTKEANFRDGVLNKLTNQSSSVTNTELQHVAQITNSGMASVYQKRYEWVSVLDDRTTDICRGRDGKVYKYGSGPMPPAHINCRSTTIPLYGGKHETPSYEDWIKSQPEAVQDDILGKAKAEKMRAGTLKKNDIAEFADANPITPEEFKKKIPLILAK